VSWLDRITEGRYTAPSGKEAVFAIETASKGTELKTGVFAFPGKDGAHVQHQGMGARTFPLSCIFSGETCMEDADAFEALLVERGIGELKHPAYGVIKAVPTGNFNREDDLVSELNQSTVTVTFTETLIDGESAVLESDAADEIDAAYAAFEDAAVEDFAAGLDTDDIEEQTAIQDALSAQTEAVTGNLEPLASSDKKSFAQWLSSVNELKDSINNLYKKAQGAASKAESVYQKGLNIARLTLRAIKTPARLAVSLSEKIRGYSALTARLFLLYRNDPFGSGKIRNAYMVSRLALTGAAGSLAAGAALDAANGGGE
jgi:prophage DNA circulation protein